jgi:hypothetical protein
MIGKSSCKSTHFCPSKIRKIIDKVEIQNGLDCSRYPNSVSSLQARPLPTAISKQMRDID